MTPRRAKAASLVGALCVIGLTAGPAMSGDCSRAEQVGARESQGPEPVVRQAVPLVPARPGLAASSEPTEVSSAPSIPAGPTPEGAREPAGAATMPNRKAEADPAALSAAGSTTGHTPAPVSKTPPPAAGAVATMPAAPGTALTPSETPQSGRKDTARTARAEPDAPPLLDLKALETRLKDTRAIGVFTKIALKNQIDDLLGEFRAYYQGRLERTLAQLRQSYDLLVLKVLALLQDSEPPLARAIVASREVIWSLLADPAKFSTL